MSHLLYVALLAGCLIGTAAVEVRFGTRVYARWLRLLSALLPTVIVFVTWDLYAIARHHWTYVPRWVTGVRLPGHLPFEELLFFLVVPTCSVITLEAVRRRRPGWVIGDEPEPRA
jgi:lycopene cyclase domain-containing protein